MAEIVGRITPALADGATKHSRATAYRLIRHMLVNPQSVERLQEQSLDWYIVRHANSPLLGVLQLT